jgi:predicted dinucleotide-binding enzyme
MKIAILGTGIVGKTIARKLSSLGHDVWIGTRDPAATLARTAPGAFGDAPLASFVAEHPSVKVATYADAARHAELVFNATSGQGALEAARLAGPANLEGKIVVDLSNPLDFSRGMPPSLTVCNDDSLGEQLQRAVPGARVVKTLNTVNAYLMVDPGLLAGGDHTMFVCGGRRRGEGHGHVDAARVVRLEGRPRSGRHLPVARDGDVPAAVGAPVRRPAEPDVQHQGRAVTSADTGGR